MIKRINIAFLLLALFIIPTNAFAATMDFGYYGTTTSTASSPVYANTTNGDADTWIDLSVSGTGHGYVVWGGDDGTGHLVEIGRNAVPADAVAAPSGAIAFWLESSDGGEIYATVGHNTNPNSDTVNFSSSGTSSGSSSTSSSCNVCQMFSCPGWADYMAELQNIKSAIPPAPDWQQVADIFNNTVTPSVISDLSNLLGSAQDPPTIPTATTPTAPAAPDMPSGLDDGGITAPTGQEDPNLGSSTFSGDDIKNNAPVITERQDPTGGFKILDPIAGLPSQAEFQANKPTEGDNIAPDPKDTSGDQATTTGPAPKDPTNTAPSPGDTTDTAPTPSSTTDTTATTGPAPSSDSSTAPIPGADNSAAPIPGGNTSTAPTP